VRGGGDRKVASLHEFVNGETDTETVVRIVNEVVPWGKQTVDTFEHALAGS